MNSQTKILVKRTFVEKNETSFIHIPLQQYNELKKDEQFKKLNNKPTFMIIEKAPFWYPTYRYVKDNFAKFILWFLATLVAALISYFIGTRK